MKNQELKINSIIKKQIYHLVFFVIFFLPFIIARSSFVSSIRLIKLLALSIAFLTMLFDSQIGQNHRIFIDNFALFPKLNNPLKMFLTSFKRPFAEVKNDSAHFFESQEQGVIPLKELSPSASFAPVPFGQEVACFASESYEESSAKHVPRHRGRPSLKHPRTSLVSVFFNASELSLIDAARGGNSRAAYIRATTLGHNPRIIPFINASQWIALSRIASNLNQYQHAVNEGRCNQISESLFESLNEQLTDIRILLLGGKRDETKNQ